MTSAFQTRNRVIEVIRRGQKGVDGDVGLTTTVTKSASFTAVTGERGYVYVCDAALTASFEGAATLTNGWHCLIDAVGGDVILDPNGAETINGLATLTVPQNGSALVYSDGTALFARFFFGSAYTALNGLPTAADKMIYGTGAGVWAETDVTANGRDILSSTTATPAELNLLDGKSLSGADATLITGTAGTSGNLALWNGDGDVVDGGSAPLIQTSGSMLVELEPGGGGSGTITLDPNYDTLEWTRIGDLVHVRCQVTVSSVSSPTGTSLRVKLCLPFNAITAAASYAYGGATPYSFWDPVPMVWYDQGTLAPSTVYGAIENFAGVRSSILLINFNPATVAVADSLYFNLTYKTDGVVAPTN